MQLLSDSCWSVVAVVGAGALDSDAARKLLIKNTRAITIINISNMRDLLLVELTIVLLRASCLYSFLCA
jgi:glutamyl-tRNA reductase